MSAIAGKTWVVKQQEESAVNALCEGLSLSPLVARLLINRGYDTVESARAFLRKSEDALGDPYLLPDMEKAVSRIRQALEAGERITVYGDYDVDGVTSTSLTYLYLKRAGGQVSYYIPDRAEEGYGLGCDALRRLREEGTTLLITVDCGITAVSEVAYAAGIGMDVVITDHHECKEKLPEAVAVINPKRPDSGYPFKEMAGVGVVFKLICALAGRERLTELLDQYGEIVAVGTVADVVPLVGENRALVSQGLGRLNRTSYPGLRALIQESGVDGKRLTAGIIGFVLAPRINAAGRLACASSAVELLLCESPREAQSLARQLCDFNRQRQEEENRIYEQAMELLRDFDPERERVILLAKEGWHHGVIGIIASRITERYGLPSLLVSLDGEEGKGSGRSVRGFSLFAALERQSELLIKFGGHEMAAGLSVKRENLPELRRRLNEYALSEHAGEQEPPLEIDCTIGGGDVTLEKATEVLSLEPYGMGNPTPVFLLPDASAAELQSIGHDKHVKLTLKKDGRTIPCFLFGQSLRDCGYSQGDRLDVVCSLDINSWRGEQTAQLIARDIRLSKEALEKQERYEALYRRFKEGAPLNRSELSAIIPVRSDFVALFRFLSRNCGGHYQGSLRAMARRLEQAAGKDFNYGKLRLSLAVFEEMELLSVSADGDEVDLSLRASAQKKNLDDSVILTGLRKSLIKCGE